LLGHSWGTEYAAKGRGLGACPLHPPRNFNFYKMTSVAISATKKMLKKHINTRQHYTYAILIRSYTTNTRNCKKTNYHQHHVCIITGYYSGTLII